MAVSAPRALSRSPTARATAAVAALAVAGIAIPATAGFDPWGWLVWARELGAGELDTAGGPSWKPLPVLIGFPLAFMGDAAAELWLLIVRVSWLAAPLIAGALAVRLAPRRQLDSAPGGAIATGAIAATGLLLLDDPLTPWLRQGATGLSEPLLVAMALGSFAAWTTGSRRLSLGLLFGCALLRPEAWLIFGWLAAHEIRAGRDRAALCLAALAIPVLWFVPDLVGSGDPLTGAGRARGDDPAAAAALEALGRLVAMPLAILWVGAVVAVLAARRDRRPGPPTLAALAAVWAAQVAVLAALGYAGLPRFMAPAAAAICVLGAVGYAAAAQQLRHGPLAGAVVSLAVAAAIVLAVGQTAWRIGDLVGDARGVSERAERERELLAAAEPLERGRVAGCAPVHLGDYLLAPAVAWRLELPLTAVRPLVAEPPGGGAALVEVGIEGADPPLEGKVLARSGGWRLIELDC